MIYQIGFIGNSSVGKTTSAFGVITELKLARKNVGYVTDRCRFVTFEPDRFDDTPEARIHIIASQIAAESEQLVRPDINYLVTERTTLDWMLYYQWTCERLHKWANITMVDLCWSWARRYDLLFFLQTEGMPYVDDGYRPKSVEQREEMDPRYQKLLLTLQHHFIFKDRLRIIGGETTEERNALVIEHLHDWLQDH
jgi:nicotinamide riboside kinase